MVDNEQYPLYCNTHITLCDTGTTQSSLIKDWININEWHDCSTCISYFTMRLVQKLLWLSKVKTTTPPSKDEHTDRYLHFNIWKEYIQMSWDIFTYHDSSFSNTYLNNLSHDSTSYKSLRLVFCLTIKTYSSVEIKRC